MGGIMGTCRLWAGLAVALFILGLIGCAETLSGVSFNSRMFSGALVENKDIDGKTQRLNIEGLESWQRWHPNTHKGDGANVIVKAQATF
jgi:hypothetical protein